MTLADWLYEQSFYLSLLLEDGTSRKHANHAFKSLSDSYAFTIICDAKLGWLESVFGNILLWKTAVSTFREVPGDVCIK